MFNIKNICLFLIMFNRSYSMQNVFDRTYSMNSLGNNNNNSFINRVNNNLNNNIIVNRVNNNNVNGYVNNNLNNNIINNANNYIDNILGNGIYRINNQVQNFNFMINHNMDEFRMYFINFLIEVFDNERAERFFEYLNRRFHITPYMFDIGLCIFINVTMVTLIYFYFGNLIQENNNLYFKK